MADTQEVLTELMKRFTDEGKIVEVGFISLRLVAMRPDAPPLQVKEMRMAFMAGAQHLFASIMNILDPGEEPTEKDLDRMSMISNELLAFQKELEAELGTKSSD